MTLEDLLVEITKAIRDAEERLLARIAQSYPQKNTQNKKTRAHLDFSEGLWIIPDALKERWRATFTAADIGAVLDAAARFMQSGQPRPPRAAYRKFLEAKLRTAHAKGIVDAQKKAEADARPHVACTNAPECQAHAQFGVVVEGVRKPFCLACADKERERQWHARRAAASRAPVPGAPSSETESHIAAMRSLLAAQSRASRAGGPQHVSALTAGPPPAREPGCDDD